VLYIVPLLLNKMALEIQFSLTNCLNTTIAIIPYDVIITGDLNIHVDVKSNGEARTFFSILDSHGLTQHINSATHKGGHRLDLVISRESSPILVGTPTVFDPCLSSNKGKSFGYHLAVQFPISVDKPYCIHRKIRYRKYRGINIK